MAIKTISLQAANSAALAQEAQKALDGFCPKLLIFFASGCYVPSNPAQALQDAFPACTVIGSSSHSEYCNNTFRTNSLVLMAIDAQSVPDLCVKVIPQIKHHPDFSQPVAEMHHYFGGYDQILADFDHYVGIVLFEGSSKAEEYCMDKLGNATDLLFVGGSSSAEEGASPIYYAGQAYEDAAILVILKTALGYDILKTQSAELFSDQGLTVTKSDMTNRILYELDNRPVGEVYAEILGVNEADITDYFVTNPLGVIAGSEIFLRTFNECEGQGISLHCGIPEGTEIHICKIGDIISDTQRDLDRVITYTPAGVINFNCLYRTLEIQNKNLVQPYCALFGRYPSIGFSTSGEAFLGHINETSTILIIK